MRPIPVRWILQGPSSVGGRKNSSYDAVGSLYDGLRWIRLGLWIGNRWSCSMLGTDNHGVLSPPLFTAAQMVSSGLGLHNCALEEDGSVQCWGWNDNGQTDAPMASFVSVVSGGLQSCGLSLAGAVTCWGGNDFGQSAPPNDAFVQIAAGQWHSCGLDADHSIQCWGLDDDGQSSAPAGTFVQISAGDAHSCAITLDGSVQCWGDNTFGQSNAPIV